MSKPKWGLLAVSKIARKFALELVSQGISIQAVASRDPVKAENFSREFNIPKSYGSYEALLADPEIDVVYISLPNQLHVEWCLRAAQAGKHILCEKPLCPTAADCEKIVEAVNRAKVFFLEGFAYRFHPLYGQIRDRIRNGALGQIRLIQLARSFDMGLNLTNIRHSQEAMGGALMDVGCYSLSLCRFLLGEEPVEFQTMAHRGSVTGVDEWTACQTGFPSGAIASFQCATRVAQPHFARIFGEKGLLEIDAPWYPDKSAATARILRGGEVHETLQAGDGLSLFAREALQVEKHLAEGQCPEMNWSDSLGQALAMEKLRNSAKWVG